MIRKEDRAYYSERLRAEREAVAKSACPSAKAAHQGLADHYAELLANYAEAVEEAATLEPGAQGSSLNLSVRGHVEP